MNFYNKQTVYETQYLLITYLTKEQTFCVN